jgi:hypothetical protein
MEPATGFEPVTSPLPRKCSTDWATWAKRTLALYDSVIEKKVKNNNNFTWSWRLDLNQRPADYKSAALPTELRQHHKASKLFYGAGNGTRTRNLQLGRLPLYQLSYSRNGGESRIRTYEGIYQRIYSPSPLAARESRHSLTIFLC